MIKRTGKFTIDVGDPNYVGAWESVTQGKEIRTIQGASLGPADAVCALIEFEDGSYAVGVGNPLRPYEHLYSGTDAEEASGKFIDWIVKHNYSEEEP